jgi:Bifunctional DNA primase/polymerase, N-terminal
MTQAELDAYLASPEAEADWQAAEQANREHREQLVEAAFRVRADELAAMAPPAAHAAPRARERRDDAGRSPSGNGASGGSDPDQSDSEPEHPLAAARWYAGRLGWNVLPGDGRRPLVGWDYATTDPAQIDDWWRDRPGADVVWLVGDRFAAIDVDVRDAYDGRDELHELERAYRPLPDTPRALTPRGGGFHDVFRVPPGVTVPAGYIAPGVDLRTGREIVALPPSHGREWEISPAELELAELPDWVIALAEARAAQKNGNGAGCGNAGAPRERVPHGGRHYYLKDRGIRFVRGGIVDADELEVLLEAEFAAYCAPLPKPERGSIRALARWCARSDIAERERWLAERIAARERKTP